MIRKPGSRHNLHSVHSTLQPLVVACMQCQNRGALTLAVDAFSDNMKSVRQLSFTSARPAVSSPTGYMFHNQREVDDFLAGKAEW
jgi:hypothetical protein